MEVVLDVYLSFPMPPHQEEDYVALHKACGSPEHIEEGFDIELSCGDNKYLSDIEDDEAELAKYDGNVCTNSVPRNRQTGKPFKVGKPYRFTIKYNEKSEEAVFYLNSRIRFSKWVG